MKWSGKPGCQKWGDHATKDHPSDGGANPQGNVAEEQNDTDTGVGDSSGNNNNNSPETVTYAGVLNASATHF